MYSEVINNAIKTIENQNILNSISTETDRIEAVDWLNNLASKIEGISNLSFNLVIKKDTTFLLFKFNDYEGYTCKDGIKIEENLIKTLEFVLNTITESQSALNILNNKLSSIRAENGILLNLKYRWGYEKCSRIAYWDYTNIVIRLGKDSIHKLLELDEHKIEELLLNFKWVDNITEFISTYNENNISKELNSCLEYKNISDALMDNMLSIADIDNIVHKNINEHSSQKLKSVHIVSELGLFAAILLWDIDYETKDISVDILDSKVIDIENNRFVSDHSLYSRIEQRVMLEADKVTNYFKSMASC